MQKAAPPQLVLRPILSTSRYETAGYSDPTMMATKQICRGDWNGAVRLLGRIHKGIVVQDVSVLASILQQVQ